MNGPTLDLTNLLAACLLGQTVKLRDGSIMELHPDWKTPSSYPLQVINPTDPLDISYHLPNGTCCIPWPERDITDILPPFLHLPQ